VDFTLVDLNLVVALLWYGSVALLAILSLSLLIRRRWGRYTAFTLYILSLTAESSILLYASKHPSVYGRIWTFSRPVCLILELSAVLAIFSRWTFSYTGIGTFGRGLLAVLMAVSVGLALATTNIGWSADGWKVAYQLMTILNRGANCCLALFLLLTVWFFHTFGGPVAPNLKRHTWSMAAFLTANAIGYFFMAAHMFVTANVLLPAISSAALVYWMFAFPKAGEIQPDSVYDKREWATAEHMNRQLQKLAKSVNLNSRGIEMAAEDINDIHSRNHDDIPGHIQGDIPGDNPGRQAPGD
jgi:hypothetical protein